MSTTTAVERPRRRSCRLEVCAHSRFTTEALVRHVLDGDDTGQLFSWMRTLSFIEKEPLGLFPHDLARDALDADLRWRDPAGYRELHRRVRAHILQRAQGSQGMEQQRACTDMLFLYRTNALVSPTLHWEKLGQGYTDVLRPVTAS